MTISEDNQKKLDEIAQKAGPIKKEEVELCIQIWRDSHRKISTVVNPSRWFNAEGMPQFIIDLVKLTKNWDDDTTFASIKELVNNRISRDSISTNDLSTNSMCIFLALDSRLDNSRWHEMTGLKS